MTIRRALMVAAAAVALILAPSVAMAAYNAPGYTSSVSDPTPAVGQSVTMTVNGGRAHGGQMIKLVITSDDFTMTLNKKTDASGTVKFTFKLDHAGTYTLKALNEAGALVTSQVITVGVVRQADTGFNGMGLALGGGAFVLLGTGAVLVARRRRSPMPV